MSGIAAPNRGAPPHFLGIGAQKAGTTWLYHNLRAHPDVWLPPEKELHYFDEGRVTSRRLLGGLFGKRPEDQRWRRQLKRHARVAWQRRRIEQPRWLARYFLGRPDDAWYLSLFAPADGRLTGEITPAYAVVDEATVAHVRELAPEARLLFFVRNPVERAWSHAMMDRRRNRVPSASSLRDSFDSEGSRLRTNYTRTLDTWASVFPPDRIFVGFLEDITFRPLETIRRVCTFLTLEPLARWRSLEETVHAGTSDSLPLDDASYLAQLHAPQLDELDRRFGGHAAWWRFAGDRLRTRAAPERIDYPLHASELWREWREKTGGRDDEPPPVQSAPLSELTAAGQGPW